MLILEEHFRTGILVYIWAKYFWIQALEARQRNVLHIYRTVPAELKDVWQEDKYERHRVRALYRSGFQFCKETINIALTTSLVLCNGFRALWDKSEEILLYLGYTESSVILHNVIFLTLLNSLNFFINLPFTAYETWAIESRAGVHRVSMSSAITGHVITQMIFFPFVCVFFALVKMGGSSTFIYVFYLAELQVILNICNFEITEALPPSELRNKIQTLLDEHDFPFYDIYVVPNPIFSTHHSQLYICGSPGQKIIAIYDNMARKHLINSQATDDQGQTQDCSIDEIVALLTHEIGHWKYGHDYVYFFINQIYLCLHIFSLHILMDYQPMYQAFGFEKLQPYAVGFVLIQSFPISDLCSSLVRVINRQLEFSADRYAKSLEKDKDLKTAVAKIGEQTSEFPVQDWLYSFCKNPQPSCHERIIALNIHQKNSSS